MQRVLAAFLTLLFLAAPSAADTIQTVSTQYYTVKGTNPIAIATDLKKNSPLNKGWNKYSANTRTDIKYSYKWERRGNRCTMKEVKVFLHLTYLYPKLARSVDRRTRNWWKEIVAKLEEHERIHGDISIKAAHELNDALESIQSENCINFKAIVKNRVNRIMKKLKQDQIAYDKLTEHGIKQERNHGRYP